jgi:S1-C subfamily serine protease
MADVEALSSAALRTLSVAYRPLESGEETEVSDALALPTDQVKPQVADNQKQPVAPLDPGLLAAYESTLSDIYTRVNPSVVNIRVVSQGAGIQDMGNLPDIPFFNMPGFPGMPEVPDQELPLQQGLGSGFVLDQQGHLITNNHVIDGASKVEVMFEDGTVARGSDRCRSGQRPGSAEGRFAEESPTG